MKNKSNNVEKSFSPAHIGYDDDFLDRRDRLLQQKSRRDERKMKNKPWWES